MVTNCVQLIADLFYIVIHERDFMSQLHKSKGYDLIDMYHYLTGNAHRIDS